MRVLPWLVLLAAAGACKAEDDGRTVTPPGGGGGGGADDDDDGGGVSDGGTGALTGEVCIVRDLENPFECPGIAERGDVLVEIVGTTATTTSDSTGAFSIDVTTATSTLQLGSEAADGLRTTRYKARLADAPISAPAINESTWDEAVMSVVGDIDAAAVVVYVRDAGAPLAGAQVTLDSGGDRFYDGAQTLDLTATETGARGMATFLGATSGEVLVSDGTRTEMATVSTAFDTTGVVVVDLGD
jgi:hypothetical protein